MSESHQEKIKRLFSLAFPTRKSFTDIDIQYEGTSGKGENFTSDVYFLKITSKNENNQLGDDEYHLILKQPPTNICEDSPIYHAFQKEIFTYGTVIATFREWEKEKKLNILDLIVPKCFLVGLYDNEMVILLENLKVSGFVLQQQHKGLDFNHLKLTLESYGKWHAFSLAYKDQYPEKFEQLFSNVTPGYLQHLPDVLKNLIELSEKTTYNILYKNKDMELYEKLRELFPNGFYSRWIEILHIKEENSAFLHGDAWKNNFLFKYKGEKKCNRVFQNRIMEIGESRKFYRSCSTRSTTKPAVNLPKSSYSSPNPPPHRSPLWEPGATFDSFESAGIQSPKLSLSSPTETERYLAEYNNKAPKSPRSPFIHNNVSSSPKSPTIFQFGPPSPETEIDARTHFSMMNVKNVGITKNNKARKVTDNKPFHSLDSDSQTVSTSVGSSMTTSISSRHSSLKEKRNRRRQFPSPNDSNNSTPTERSKIHRCRKSTSDLTDMTDECSTTTTTALSRSNSRKSSKGGLAYLASRRSSRGSRGSRESVSSVLSNASNEGLGPLNFQHPQNRQRRTSNFLELPVPDHIRPRVCSLPEKTINPRLSDDLYRLRTFSITNKGVINCGDSIINRRSRSNTSVNSITSRSNVSGERSPFDGSCCGSGYHSVGSESFESINNAEIPKYRVVLLGDAGVGKTALVSQFMTSEYMNTYDASLDDEFGERTVSILLDGHESEMVFIDHPAAEMSVENSLSTYEPHACIIIYSITSRSTFQTAEEILNYLWKEGYTKDKAVIIVANKADLARARVISPNEGKGLAVAKDCKFIETSSGIQHNVDELLVGILKQIRLRETLEKKKSMAKEKGKMKGSKTSLRLHFAKEILQKICLNDISKSKSCENLHVL